MTSNHYVIDSCSLIDLNKYSPIDVFPSLWEKLSSLINQGFLVAPKEVFKEITERDDELAKWAKRQARLFIEPTENHVKIVREILEKHNSMVDADRKNDADSWVVALAVDLKNSPQRQIIPVKIVVVTEEKIKGNQIKIPLVCQEYDIEAINIMKMIRTEGWTF